MISRPRTLVIPASKALPANAAGHPSVSADLLLELVEIDDGMAVRLLRDLAADLADVGARLRARAA